MNVASRLGLQRAATILALFGILLAGYLTRVHYDASALVCGLGNCHTVQQSEFATIGLVPVALLGLGMYVAIFACNVLALSRPHTSPAVTSIAFAVALSGAIYALFLTWLEVAVIGAICQWCVASAILTLVLAIVEGAAVWQEFGGAIPDSTETAKPADASISSDGQGRGTAGAGRPPAFRSRIST